MTPANVENNAAGLTQIENLFRQFINISVGAAFVALVVMLVWAGVRFLTSGGDAKALQSAGMTITWAILGMLFLVIAWLVLQLIAAFTGLDVLKTFDIRTLCGTGGIQWCPR